jgi:S1-C subfamily serine protease
MSKTFKIAGLTLVALLVFAAAAFAGISLVSAQQQQNIAAPAAQAPAGSTAAAEKGLVVVSVTAGSAADQAGVKRGDILLKINDTETNAPADLKTALKDAKTGDPLVLSITHGDEAKTLTATLTDLNGRPALGLLTWGGPVWNEAGEMGGLFGKSGQMPAGQAGALITSVTEGSPAALAGLKKDDRILAVNGKDLAPDYDLVTAIQANKAGEKVTLKVLSGQETKEVAVTLADKDGKAYLGVQYSSLPAIQSGGQLPQMPNGGGFGFRRGGQGGQLPVPQGLTGIVLMEVQKDSPAEKAGLKVNDIVTAIDGVAIDQGQPFSAAVAAHRPGDVITLSVTHPDQTTAEVKVTLGENPTAAGKAFLGVKIIGLSEMHQNLNPGQQGAPLPTPAPGTNG